MGFPFSLGVNGHQSMRAKGEEGDSRVQMAMGIMERTSIINFRDNSSFYSSRGKEYKGS